MQVVKESSSVTSPSDAYVFVFMVFFLFFFFLPSLFHIFALLLLWVAKDDALVRINCHVLISDSTFENQKQKRDMHTLFN